MSSPEAVFQALNEAMVCYLVADGVAVIAHGYMRTTNDLDLILAFDDENMNRAETVFTGLGYTPLLPVTLYASGALGFRKAQDRLQLEA